MPRSEQDSATEGVPQAVEDTTVPNAPQPSEFTPKDTPAVREKRRPARESGLRGKVVVITGAVAGNPPAGTGTVASLRDGGPAGKQNGQDCEYPHTARRWRKPHRSIVAMRVGSAAVPTG